jgi:hypothetical protein
VPGSVAIVELWFALRAGCVGPGAVAAVLLPQLPWCCLPAECMLSC